MTCCERFMTLRNVTFNLLCKFIKYGVCGYDHPVLGQEMVRWFATLPMTPMAEFVNLTITKKLSKHLSKLDRVI